MTRDRTHPSPGAVDTPTSVDGGHNRRTSVGAVLSTSTPCREGNERDREEKRREGRETKGKGRTERLGTGARSWPPSTRPLGRQPGSRGTPRGRPTNSVLTPCGLWGVCSTSLERCGRRGARAPRHSHGTGVVGHVLDVAQAAQRERVAVAHPEADEARDRGMHRHEPVPFPRNRVEAEQLTEQHAVGT